LFRLRRLRFSQSLSLFLLRERFRCGGQCLLIALQLIGHFRPFEQCALFTAVLDKPMKYVRHNSLIDVSDAAESRILQKLIGQWRTDEGLNKLSTFFAHVPSVALDLAYQCSIAS